MSSEQVIAEMRDFAKGATIMDVMDAPAIVAKWADRLSTPAAGQDDDPMRLVRGQARAWEAVVEALDRAVPDWNRADGTCSMDRACKVIQQLQARNAEQAFGLERSREAHADMELRYLTMRTKLTALLDGIEGLEAKFRERSEFWWGRGGSYGDGSSLTFADCADELQALRESSTPAIGGEDG